MSQKTSVALIALAVVCLAGIWYAARPSIESRRLQSSIEEANWNIKASTRRMNDDMEEHARKLNDRISRIEDRLDRLEAARARQTVTTSR